MPDSPDKLVHFWQELKDRRVLRVITVYVAVSFGLLELIDIVSGPLGFPGWVLTIFIYTSAFGLPIAIILSWLFIATPNGLKRYGHYFLESGPGRPHESSSVEKEQFTDRLLSDDLIVVESDIPSLKIRGKSAKRKGRIYGLSSFTVIGLVIVLFLFYSGTTIPFDVRDWVVIADFNNYTGEEIFERSLNTAFSVSINQSRHINVVPRRRMQEALKRMEKEGNEAIDEALCREIALREGV
ncbi:MAG: hypothetical protein KAT15_32070, partial [Bacteroidales bacterium]|nr:hypothetical protein [Bacteroidales bacterium]